MYFFNDFFLSKFRYNVKKEYLIRDIKELYDMIILKVYYFSKDLIICKFLIILFCFLVMSLNNYVRNYCLNIFYVGII